MQSTLNYSPNLYQLLSGCGMENRKRLVKQFPGRGGSLNGHHDSLLATSTIYFFTYHLSIYLPTYHLSTCHLVFKL